MAKLGCKTILDNDNDDIDVVAGDDSFVDVVEGSVTGYDQFD